MIHAAVFLITFSGLVFEIGLTRIYSATIWYHFAFVAVSVALLGWGLGGLLLHLLGRRMRLSLNAAAWLTVGYALSIPVCLSVIGQFPFQMDRLALYFLAPLVPFLLAGIALSIIFALRRDIAPSLYFADLVGASLGALAVTFLLQALGGETTLLVAALAPAIAAALLADKASRIGGVWAVLLAVLAVTGASTGAFRVAPGELKALPRHVAETPGARVTQTGWNAYSRIDAVEGFADPYLARLYIDSDAWTNTLRWDGRIESLDVKDTYRALPFRFTPNAHTLVIGPGGGSDAVVALGSGSRKVTVVELNPLMLEFVRHYGPAAGSIYNRPDVEVIQSEGRNFISRTDQKFDVIFLGFVDTWASVASGGLSLSENYLYTSQAIKAYYDHLSDDGVLAIMRWDMDIPRLVTNTISFLGVEEASKRIVAVLERRGAPDDPAQMIFLLRKRPFTAMEGMEVMEGMGWKDLARPVLVPGLHADQPWGDLFAGRKSLDAVIAEHDRRIDPVFDNSPFYFAIERPWGVPYYMRVALSALVLPVAGLLAVFVLFGQPRGERVVPYAASIVYFGCLGAGFIAVELALLQHLTLLVGHPIFTLSLLLCTILAAGGVGSALSNRVSMRTACLLAAGFGTVAALVLPALIPSLLPLSLGARIAVAVALLVPLGLVMGMPFPQGLRRTGQGSLPAPPFYWGLNGVMSVIGSVATVLVALVFGFQVAMLSGCALYLIAALSVSWIGKFGHLDRTGPNGSPPGAPSP
jgi:predicted membrane-bound spermidine synthase